MKKLYLMLTVVLVSFLMTGCDRLSDSALADHQSAIDLNAVIIKKTEDNIKHFETMLKDEKFSFIKDYNGQEKWDIRLKAHNASVIRHGSEYKKKMTPVIERDESKDNGLVTQESFALKKHNNKEVRSSNEIIAYIKNMQKFSSNKTQYLDSSIDKQKKIASHYNLLKRTLNDYSKKYPNRKDDFDFKYARLLNMHKDAQKSLIVVSKEHDASYMNINDFATHILNIEKLEMDMQNYFSKNNKLLKELDRSYIKLLKEERIEYFVKIGYAHWCESDGCGNGTESTRLVQVDEEIFEMADVSQADILVRMVKGWSSIDVKVFENHKLINGLKLDLNSIPNRDSYMEYWIEDTIEKPYHKYTIIENDKITHNKKWEAVSSDLYWQFEGMIGLPLYSKPYGYYDSEATKESTNILAQTIAEPEIINGVPHGSNQYGEWQTHNGNSFFHYYVQYALISSLLDSNHSYYSRSGGYHYSGYNRNPIRHKKTFMDNKKKGLSNHTRMAGFNPKVTRKITARYQPTVRNGGGKSRGKGPSGGGK